MCLCPEFAMAVYGITWLYHNCRLGIPKFKLRQPRLYLYRKMFSIKRLAIDKFEPYSVVGGCNSLD